MARESTSGSPLEEWPVGKSVDDGSSLSDKLNDFREAVYTLHSDSSSTRPSYLDSYAGALWLDNSTASSWKLYIYDGSHNIELFRIDTTTNAVTPPAYSSIDINVGSPASMTPHTSYDDLTLKSDSHCGISILGPDANNVGIVLGSVSDTTGVLIRWNYSTDLFTLGTTKSGAALSLTSGNGTPALYISSAQRIGINNTSPNSSLHIGGSTDAMVSTETGAGHYIFNGGSDGAKIMLHGSSELALQFYRSDNTVDNRFGQIHFVQELGVEYLRLALFNDSLVEKYYAWSVRTDNGTLFLGKNDVVFGAAGSTLRFPSLAGTGTRNVVVDSSGNISAP